MSEKKSRYTEAQKRSAEKYMAEKVENMQIRVQKGKKTIIQEHAASQGESMNQFVNRAIDETMQREREVTS
jgi:predicted HicB family RNase H-like nuclease